MLAQGTETLKKSFGFAEALFFEIILIMRNIKWEIGCSGFHYKEWEGIFYPEPLPQREWFRFYAEKFNTLELNVTFYRFPVLKSLEKWHNVSPDNFRFAVKAPRLITHYKKFSDCARLIDDFYKLITEGLKDKLGPVLFQLPPRYAYTDARLELIVKSMYKQFSNVIEFRDASWWSPAIFNRLKKEKIIFCGIDYPGLPNDPVIINKIVYYRFHGKPRLYYSAYKKKELNYIADSILKNKLPEKVYVFFNNTSTASAIKNAVTLKRYIHDQSVIA